MGATVNAFAEMRSSRSPPVFTGIGYPNPDILGNYLSHSINGWD